MAIAQVALVLGVDQLGPIQRSCAEADAQRIGAFLRDHGHCEVYEKTGSDVTVQAIDEMVTQVGRNPPRALVLYYAGPATVVEGKLHLAGDGAAGNKAIDLLEILRIVSERSGADEILAFIDAPRKGVSEAPEESTWEPESLFANLPAGMESSGQHITAVFGCSKNEFCWETRQGGQGGLFTSALIHTLSAHGAIGTPEEFLKQIDDETEFLSNVVQSPRQRPALVRPPSKVQPIVVEPSAGPDQESQSWKRGRSRRVQAGIGAGLLALLTALALITKNTLPDPARVSGPASNPARPSTEPLTTTKTDQAMPEASRPEPAAESAASAAPAATPASPAKPPAVAESPPAPTPVRDVPEVRVIQPIANEQDATPRYSLLVYTNTIVASGSKIPLADAQLNGLGFEVRYRGPQPPSQEIRVEWWLNNHRISPYEFNPGDPSLTGPHKYNNHAELGNFEVRLLVDGRICETVKFDITESGT
jgi:Caspase domain